MSGAHPALGVEIQSHVRISIRRGLNHIPMFNSQFTHRGLIIFPCSLSRHCHDIFRAMSEAHPDLGVEVQSHVLNSIRRGLNVLQLPVLRVQYRLRLLLLIRHVCVQGRVAGNRNRCEVVGRVIDG